MTLNLTIATGILITLVGLATRDGGGSSETPFYCNLKALSAAERAEHQHVTARVLAAVSGTRELPNGYAFSLGPGTETRTGTGTGLTIRDLAMWVDFERRCCPFFDVQLDWRRENGPVTLQLTGRDGVKEFIRAEFTPLFRK